MKRKTLKQKAHPGRVQHGRYIGYLRHVTRDVKRKARKIHQVEGVKAAIKFLVAVRRQRKAA